MEIRCPITSLMLPIGDTVLGGSENFKTWNLAVGHEGLVLEDSIAPLAPLFSTLLECSVSSPCCASLPP